MNHKNIEKTFGIEDNLIDATLTTLRTAAPPTGLEDRLLHSLEAAQQRTPASEEPRVWVPHVSNLRHGWIATALSPRLWAGTALAATILAVAFSIHLHRRPTPATTVATVATVQTESRAADLPNAGPAHRPAPHSSFVVIPQRSGGTCVSLAQRPCTSLANNIERESASPSPYEQAALADALAPSHPAPPLPLTHQERLLLRILQRGDYTELAELNPAVRSVREAQQLADFQSFFPSPKPHPQPDPASQTAPTIPGDKQ